MSKNGSRVGAMALTSAALLGAGASSAWADSPSNTPASLSGIQAKAAAAITLRINDLNAAVAKVNAAKSLGSSASTLNAYLQADIAPLQQLGQKIAADTSVTTAKNDAASIYSSYRVLALVLPAVRLAGDSDAVANGAVPKLTADSAQATSHMNVSNQATVQPLITDLNSQISAATSATSGLASTVLGYTPSQWNANKELLTSARSTVETANGDIKKARADLVRIRADVKGSAPAAAPATTTN